MERYRFLPLCIRNTRGMSLLNCARNRLGRGLSITQGILTKCRAATTANYLGSQVDLNCGSKFANLFRRMNGWTHCFTEGDARGLFRTQMKWLMKGGALARSAYDTRSE